MKEFIKTEAGRDSANFMLQSFVATVIMLIAIGTLIAMVMFADRLNSNTNFSMWIGAVIGWVGSLAGFCFPNSIGAQRQSDTINKLASSAAAPLTTTTVETVVKDPAVPGEVKP